MKKAFFVSTAVLMTILIISSFRKPPPNTPTPQPEKTLSISASKISVQIVAASFCTPKLIEIANMPVFEESTIASTPIPDVHATSAYHDTQYNTLIARVRATRDSFNAQIAKDSSLKDSIYREARIFLLNTLTRDVFPYWYGTPWDFNGISNVPKEGKIACGYFISTTLKHIGFNMNRYRVAQKGATEIIHTLSGKENSRTFYDVSSLQNHLLSKPDGVYIVGLSSHVGFIEKRGSEVYFTHSNYLIPAEVLKEQLLSSPAIQSSDIYVLGAISLSNQVIELWLHKTEIKV